MYEPRILYSFCSVLIYSVQFSTRTFPVINFQSIQMFTELRSLLLNEPVDIRLRHEADHLVRVLLLMILPVISFTIS